MQDTVAKSNINGGWHCRQNRPSLEDTAWSMLREIREGLEKMAIATWLLEQETHVLVLVFLIYPGLHTHDTTAGMHVSIATDKLKLWFS